MADAGRGRYAAVVLAHAGGADPRRAEPGDGDRVVPPARRPAGRRADGHAPRRAAAARLRRRRRTHPLLAGRAARRRRRVPHHRHPGADGDRGRPDRADGLGLRPMTRRALLLPGRAYPVSMPLLAATGAVLSRHGWAVRPVSWAAPEPVPTDGAWVGRQAAAAMGEDPGPWLFAAKSLGTRVTQSPVRAAAYVLLTPLTADPAATSA